MSIISRFLAIAAGCASLCGVHASLQGLYTLSPGQGQLRRVDWLNGTTVDVGSPLASAGLDVAPCAASVVQQTNKWYFTLATNATASPEASAISGQSTDVHLVGVSLDDAELRYFRTLPKEVFPDSAGLQSCDYTLDVDGGLVLFVSAAVGDRLLTVRFEPTPSHNESRSDPQDKSFHFDRVAAPEGNMSVVVNVSVSALGLGGRVAFPSSAMLPSGDWWYQLEQGVACHSVRTGKFVNQVRLPQGAVLGGLSYSLSSLHVHGVLTPASSSDSRGSSTMTLAQFDPLAATPTLLVSNGTFPLVERNGAAAALLSDKVQMSVLTQKGQLVTVDLNTAARVSIVDLCSPARKSGLASSAECPASIGYLPYVF
eukprot:INCI13729.1.p1 GENE.INCI13729.1~~INCI13729.1.p1  ORF type:complete len:370 (-),score=49.51 INCI13729.1:23-1132(-)